MSDPLIITCGGCGTALVDYIYCTNCCKTRGDLSCTACGWAKQGQRLPCCTQCSKAINQRVIECCREVARRRGLVVSSTQVVPPRPKAVSIGPKSSGWEERVSAATSNQPTAQVKHRHGKKHKKADERKITPIEQLALRVDSKTPKTDAQIQHLVEAKEEQVVSPDDTSPNTM